MWTANATQYGYVQAMHGDGWLGGLLHGGLFHGGLWLLVFVVIALIAYSIARRNG
jgi:hypothetical protein